MADLVKKLKVNNIDVFLVSGGFRQMIKVGPVISYHGSFRLSRTQICMLVIFQLLERTLLYTISCNNKEECKKI
jgi:hypothetical protein